MAGKRWSKEEKDYVRDNYESLTYKEIGAKLNRSESSISKAVKGLGLVKENNLGRYASMFSESEVNFIKENYILLTAKEIADTLGYTPAQISTKANSLGLKRGNRWTESEEEQLKSNYMKKTDAELAHQLNKSVTSIKAKRYGLGLIRHENKSVEQCNWTESDYDIIKNMYLKGFNDEEISYAISDIKKTPKRIKDYRHRKGLCANKGEIIWCVEEDEIMRQCYENCAKETILKALPNRSWNAIVKRARALKLIRSRKARGYMDWTKEKDDYIINNCNEKTDKEIGEFLGVKYYLISKRRKELGYKNEYNCLNYYSEEELSSTCSSLGYEYVRKYRAYTSDTGKSYVHYIEIKCPKHGIQSVYFSKLINIVEGKGGAKFLCPVCYVESKTKYTEEFMVNYCMNEIGYFNGFNSPIKGKYTRINIICESCGESYSPTFQTIQSKKPNLCSHCDVERRARLLSKTLEEVKEEFKNTNIIILSKEYYSNSKPLSHLCKKHLGKGVQYGSYANLIKHKRCYYCGREIANNSKRKSTDQYEKQISQVSNGRLQLLTEYASSDEIIEAVCKDHNMIIRRKATHLLINPYCAKCTNGTSKGELKINDFLKSKDCDFVHQYRIDNCRNKKPLPFDFAMFEQGKLKVLVEYQGEGHHKPINFGGISDKKAKEHYEGVVFRDNIKKNYCIDNGIALEEIHYFENVEQRMNEIYSTYIKGGN